VGRGTGWLFILGGIWLVFTGLWINGLWLTFVGWFLQNAARECPPVRPDISIDQLIHDHILDSGHRCFPVVENSGLVGLISFRDVKGVPRDLRAAKTVRDAMTPLDRLKKVGPGDDLVDVLQLLTTEDVNQVPVMDNGNIIGMVARDALLSFIRVRGELDG